MALRILVLGSGGREHALVWKLAQSTLVSQIFVCLGNGGTDQVPKAKNISVGNNTFEELVAFATQEKVPTTKFTSQPEAYDSFRSLLFSPVQNSLSWMA